MRIAFVYEHFFAPFDEGIKILAHQIYRHYESEHEVTLIRYYQFLPNALNSLMIVPRLITLLVIKRPEKLVFIPQAALTFSSLIKLFLLQLFYGDKLVAVGVQRRQLKTWQARLLRRIALPRTYVLSKAMADPLEAIGLKAGIIKVGIDREAYRPTAERLALRKHYGIEAGKRVLLHVGHIRESRNINWLLDIKAALPELEIILVGSTTTEQDKALCLTLEDGGIRVIREYLPNICEIYQISDIYCFPVMRDTAAMETPLSVLEAMATNLPVVTTRYGRLPEQFDDSHCYRYVSNVREIIETLKTDFGQHCDNRGKTSEYSWRSTAERLLA